MRKFLTSSGFSLMEMMAVLAIFALLTLVAKPRYDNQVARARQSEAKVSLGGMLVAERSYYSDMKAYTGCVIGLGVKPPLSPFLYMFGANPSQGGSGVNVSSTLVSCSSTTTVNVHYYAANKAVNTLIANDWTTYGGAWGNFANTNLNLAAIGFITNTSVSTKLDIWTIGESGTLTNPTTPF